MMNRSIWIALAKGLLVLTTAMGLSSANAKDDAARPVTPKPHIVILATGGTIAGRHNAAGPGYRSGEFPVDALLMAVPALKDIASFEAEQISAGGSQDMNDTIWRRLAKRISELEARADVSGIVITHGTDTLEETAFFLDLLFPLGKPVVLTAATRPADAVSPDGPRNILDAVSTAAAKSARDRGALVVLNGEVHSARRVSKVSTDSIAAFSSGPRGLLGQLVNGAPNFFGPPRTKLVGANLIDPSALPERFPKVATVLSHAGVDADILRLLPGLDYRGIVLAGVGAGNSSATMLETLKHAAANGVAVVRASRVGHGAVERNIEVDDDAGGFVASYDLNPQKARVLLQAALSLKLRAGDLQRAFSCEMPMLTRLCSTVRE